MGKHSNGQEAPLAAGVKYFRVRNFEKFQHYKDRRPPWIKFYQSLFGEHRFYMLAEEERYVLLAIFMVAAQNDNKILNDPKWLARECITSPGLIKRTLALLFQDVDPVEGPWLEEITPATVLKPKIIWASRYVSDEQRARILARDDNKCVKCGSVELLEIDHVIPISKGGTGEDSNLQTLCRSCNRRKHNNAPDASPPSSNSGSDASPALDRTSADARPSQSRVEENTETEKKSPLPPLLETGPVSQAPAGVKSRPRDLAMDHFVTRYQTLLGSPYAIETQDAVMLAKLRKNWQCPNLEMPPTWGDAVENYLATPQGRYTLADLANPTRYAIFRISALDRYGKPIEHVNAGRNGSYEQSGRESRTAAAADAVVEKLAKKIGFDLSSGAGGGDDRSVPGKTTPLLGSDS